MNKMIIKNGMVMIGKMEDIKREIKKLPPGETLKSFIKKNLN